MNESHNIKLTAEISATSKGLVEALQKASGAVNDASQNWKGKFNTLKESTSVVGQSIKNLTDLIGQVGKVDLGVEGMDKVKASIADVSNTFAQVRGEVESFASTLAEMKNTASNLGMPIEEYQRFSDAVKEAGMSIGEAHTAIETMQANIKNLANGVPEAQELFGKLGLSIEQLSSNTATGNFDALVQALRSTIPPTEQAKASMDLFKTSMQEAVKVSQEYNKLLVTQKDNAYASDKDVQNAISLSNAIGKLGEQLGNYVGKVEEAEEIHVGFEKSIEAIYNPITQLEASIEAIKKAYETYVDTLKSSAGTVVDASNMFDIFREAINNVGGDSALQQIKQLRAAFQELGEQAVKEGEAIDRLMDLRIKAGAPIDISEIEEAKKHIEQLAELQEQLVAKTEEVGGIGDGWDYLNSKLAETTEQLGNLQTHFDETFASAQSLNQELSFNEAKQKVQQLDGLFAQLKKNLKSGKIDIDFSDIDKVIAGLQEIQKQPLLSQEQLEQVDELSRKFEDFKRKSLDAIDKAGKSTFRRLLDGIKSFGRGATESGGQVRGVEGNLRNSTNEARRLKQAMDEFNASAQKGKNETAALGGNFAQMGKQVAGQLLGMGSQVAIIVKGIKTIGDAINYYWLDGLRNAWKLMKDIAAMNTKSQTEVSDRRIETSQNVMDDLKRLYELRQKARSEGATATDENAYQQQIKDMRARYMGKNNPYGKYLESIDKDFGEGDFDERFEHDMAQAQKDRIDAEEAVIKSLHKERDALDESYEKLDKYKSEIGSFEHKRQRDRELEDIRKKQGEIDAEIARRMQALSEMKASNPLQDFKTTQQAKRTDETLNREREAEKAAEKAKEEQAKALEEANKKLQEWSNEFNDNGRQKKIRAIMDKYEQLVEAGVDETEARNVAEKALAEMLEEERVERIKKNKELLDALDKSIATYKKAYEDYLNAQRQVNEAQREYAQTQRDLSRQARAERLQRRREAIARRLQTFGFQLPTGFRMNESRSSARRRVRRRELDESIQNKLQDWLSGKKVHWTKQERNRLKDYQRLQRKDRQLEAAQKQMDAADKQKQAAEALQKAADAIRVAMFGRSEAAKGLGKANAELNQASRRKGWIPDYVSPSTFFDDAKNKGLNAAGVKGRNYTRQMNYNGALSQLHNDLMDIMKKAYLVR